MVIYSLLKNNKALSNTPFSTGKLLAVHSPSSLVLNPLEIFNHFGRAFLSDFGESGFGKVTRFTPATPLSTHQILFWLTWNSSKYLFVPFLAGIQLLYPRVKLFYALKTTTLSDQ